MAANRTVLEQIAHEIFPQANELTHLGTGGFACTFRVVDGGQLFALKIIDPGLSETERVDRELSALQRVNHPGVVKFLGVGSHDHAGVNYRWIRMEFVPGHSLGALLAEGQIFTALEAIALLKSLVEGASSIWAQRTAHRDLSPGNIVLRPDGSAVIVDLGLARHVDDGTYTALPTPGTPGWMSPEQVSSTPTHGDWRSDQFVLGALGYLLLTNVCPFYAPSIVDRWVAPALQTPQPIRAIDPNVPTAAADVIERMLEKRPHRRYLKPEDLVADLDRAIFALEASKPVDEPRPQHFLVNVAQVKNFAEKGFLSVLSPHGVVIDMRAGKRVAEFVAEAAAAKAISVVDPVTHFVRSPDAVRPAFFKALPYGNNPTFTGFSDDIARTDWCRVVLEHELETDPDVAIAPYFYAGEGEAGWIAESLACAAKFEELMQVRPRGATHADIWTAVAVHSTWLSNESARDTLLTALTGQPMKALYLLVATSQPSLGPLGDSAVLHGLRDLLTVLREAGIPVIVGKRASSGLLLLSLGADGWSSGTSGNLMNMSAHPEEDEDGGPSLDRIYVPSLLNLISLSNFILMLRSRQDLVGVNTPQALALLSANPDLESLTTDQRILLKQHNLVAQKAQVDELAFRPAGQRIALLRSWVEAAAENYRALPPTRLPSENAGFLAAWAEALS